MNSNTCYSLPSIKIFFYYLLYQVGGFLLFFCFFFFFFFLARDKSLTQISEEFIGSPDQNEASLGDDSRKYRAAVFFFSPTPSFFFFFFFFAVVDMLARQVLYQLSHSASLVFVLCFSGIGFYKLPAQAVFQTTCLAAPADFQL
jgi:hypothetical protein